MRRLRTTLALVLLGGVLMAPGAGHSAQSAAPAYRFEPEAQAAGAARDPKLALRASGAIYMLAIFRDGEAARLGLAASHDGGEQFAPPVFISEREARVHSHGENSPSMAFGPSEVYTLWEQSLPEGGTELMFARSLRFGQQFDRPVRVTDKKTPSSNGYSHLAVAPSGHVYAVWLDGRDQQTNPPGTSSVYLARSADRGATFGPNVRVAASVCPCCRPAVAVGARGEVYVAWRQVFGDNVRDIAMAVSTDGGRSFTPPRRVAVDNWKIAGCPHSGAALATHGGRLYVAWYSEGDGTNAGVRVAWTDDGGATFSRPLMASRGLVDTNHPALSVSEDGAVLLVFQGRDPADRESWGPARAYLVQVSEGGLSAPVPVPGNRKSVAYPTVLAASLGRAYVAWTESGEGGPRAMFTRGRKL